MKTKEAVNAKRVEESKILEKPTVKQIASIGNIGIGDWGKFPRTVDVSTV